MTGPLRIVCATVSIALVTALPSPIIALDCGVQVNGCIAGNAGKPDAKAKCAAAGQTCAQTGVFVSPFSGKSYGVRKCGEYNRSQACY